MRCTNILAEVMKFQGLSFVQRSYGCIVYDAKPNYIYLYIYRTSKKPKRRWLDSTSLGGDGFFARMDIGGIASLSVVRIIIS